MEPVATYSETRLMGKRYFELFADRVRITGKVYWQSDFDVTIPLTNVLPYYETIRIREKICGAGVVLAAVPVVLFVILYELSKEVIVYPAMVCMLAVGVVTSVFTFRKIEYRQFRNSSNGVVFNVARSGKGKHSFDRFVEQLVSRIEECNR
ncbi:MAG: hypothetical protein IH624_03735 [Phycisphaerae bacterium]|nr:hypothetical protein [Phycisphaerae bacterium]